MATASQHKRDFPMRLAIKGHVLVLRPLERRDREPLLRFARSLPERDLLFLQRDITEPAEADKWIADVADGDLVTIVAWEGEVVLGYASYARGNARWTRHVAELRVVVAESARSLGIGKLMLELVFEMALGEGVTKVVACMTPDQAGAQRLFKRLGFEQEAVLRDHADVCGRSDLRSAALELPDPAESGPTLPFVRCSRAVRSVAGWRRSLLALLRDAIRRTGRRRLGVAPGREVMFVDLAAGMATESGLAHMRATRSIRRDRYETGTVRLAEPCDSEGFQTISSRRT